MKEVGKIYINNSGAIFVLCTGEEREKRTFCGTIIKMQGRFSNFKVGDHSNTWSDSVFSEYEGKLELDNMDWIKDTFPSTNMG